MISVASSILFFTIITIAYFIIKYLIGDRFEIKSSGLAIACTFIYLAITVATQCYINIQNAKEK